MEDSRLTQFSKDGIQYVRMAFVDTSNIVRFRIVPTSKFLRLIDSTEIRGLFMSMGVLGLMAHEDRLAVGVTPLVSCRGEMCLVPDFTGKNANLHRLHSALHSVATSTMIDEMVQGILAQGIEISQFHAESAPGQFEFVLDPYDPLLAVDNLIRARETIYNIAAKYDLKAILAPKVFADYAGSGSHCNISIQKCARVNVSSPGPYAPEGLSSLEENFLAGILKHLSSICAFALPHVTSYNRTQENCCAGSYICWRIDNREATLRLAYTPGVKRKFRFEVKCVDGTANPYLAVSAIIVAGLDGIRQNLQLTLKELTFAPDQLGTRDKLESEKLPRSIEEALSILEEPTEYELYCNGMGK